MKQTFQITTECSVKNIPAKPHFNRPVLGS